MNKRWIMGCLAVVLFALAAGCATLPSKEEMALDISGYELPKQPEADSALIYVVRPSGLGPIVRFNVFLDDKEDASEMGYTRGSQYVYFFVTPGIHTIYSKAENWANISVKVKPRDVIFIKQTPSIGFIMARNSLDLVQETEGKYDVKNTSLGTIKKERK